MRVPLTALSVLVVQYVPPAMQAIISPEALVLHVLTTALHVLQLQPV